MDNSLVERVKEYNKKYKEATDELNKVNAQINVYEQEIGKLCAELTASLGVEVTKENALELYKQKSEEIERNLALGNEILDRINSSSSSNSPSSPNDSMKFADEFTPVQSTVEPSNNSPKVDVAAFNGMFSTAIDDI